MLNIDIGCLLIMQEVPLNYQRSCFIENLFNIFLSNKYQYQKFSTISLARMPDAGETVECQFDFPLQSTIRLSKQPYISSESLRRCLVDLQNLTVLARSI